MNRTGRSAAAVLLWLAVLLAGCGGSSSPLDGATDLPAAVDAIVSEDGLHHSGFIPLPDGALMKYSLHLPAREGRYPVIVEYDGYSAGSTTSAPTPFTERGYAYLGLNVRGTGCSTGGPWNIFSPQWGRDGAYAIEWAAAQPWSTGKVGMWGVSFSGYMQLWTAAFQPRGLEVIVPGAVVTDILRDVPRPGGVPNVLFPSLWWSVLNQTWLAGGAQGVAIGHEQCADIAAANARDAQSRSVPHTMLEMTHESAFTLERSANRYTHAIRVPTLGLVSWQDEQVGSRAGYYEETVAPQHLWLVGTNGGHGSYISLPEFQDLALRFYDRFLKGVDNGAERTPRFQLWNEIASGSGAGRVSWISTQDAWPVQPTPMRWYLRGGRTLAPTPPAAAEPPDHYAYPVAAPAVSYPSASIGPVDVVNAWMGVPNPAGTLVYTTPPLTEDLMFYGPASADLWLSSTAGDTDLQLTLTEVRPDGLEMYVQRGWLRASERALDSARSSTLRPHLLQTEAARAPLVPGEPTLVRAEILRFAHTFRRGSRLRLIVDTPSQTGLWGFAITPTRATNTIWHDPERPSSLVLGRMASPAELPPQPACDTVVNQPCRPDTLALAP